MVPFWVEVGGNAPETVNSTVPNKEPMQRKVVCSYQDWLTGHIYHLQEGEATSNRTQKSPTEGTQREDTSALQHLAQTLAGCIQGP